MKIHFTREAPDLVSLKDLSPGDCFILNQDRYASLPSPRILCLLWDTKGSESWSQIACFSAGESKVISVFADAKVIKLDATLSIDTHGVYIKGMEGR